VKRSLSVPRAKSLGGGGGGGSPSGKGGESEDRAALVHEKNSLAEGREGADPSFCLSEEGGWKKGGSPSRDHPRGGCWLGGVVGWGGLGFRLCEKGPQASGKGPTLLLEERA